jgi:hypothetical protein
MTDDLRDSSGKLVPVGRLTVPLGTMAALIAVLAGGVVSVSGAWYAALAHSGDKVVHLDQARAVTGGGPAYERGVEAAITASTRKMRAILRTMVIRCSKAGTGFGCTVELPEDE